jgi:exosortase/archaeosortase family protein
LLGLLAIAMCAVHFVVGFDYAIVTLNRSTAASTYWLLGVLDAPAILDQDTLTHPEGFASRIVLLCTALLPTAFIFAFLFLMPVSSSNVALGTLVGAAVVAVVNSFRLAGLYYVGVNYPQYFDLAHDWAGQALIIVTTLAYLVYWLLRTGTAPRL